MKLLSREKEGSTPKRSERYLAPIIVFVMSRAVLLVVAWQAPHLLSSPHLRGNGSLLPRNDWLSAAGNWTRPWFRFDTGWYVGVAKHEYHWGPPAIANTNFLPLYPALIRVIQPVVGGDAWVAAWLVANLAALAATLLLWRWALARYPRRVALRVVLLVTFFPFAFFFVAPYAESLFLALAVATFIFAEADRWPLAVLTAGLSTITRPVGLAVVLALVVLALQQRNWLRLAATLTAILPLVGFMIYLGLAFGHPLGFLTSHSGGWLPAHGGLLTTVTSQFHTYLSPFDRLDAFIAVLFLACSVLVSKRLGPAYAVYVFAGVGLPLLHGLVGIERYAIVLFPVMTVWATTERRWLQVSAFAVSVVGIIVATTMYATGYTLI